MSRGFYTLSSGILTQNRVLDTVTNNIANVNTPGFKKNKVVSTSFGEMYISRIDAQNTKLNKVSIINTAAESSTIHTQGIIKHTGRTLDFAVQGQGFFAVQTDNGNVYTRNGSFNVDAEGYLVLKDVGRVMGTNGPIYAGTDDITADSLGNIYVEGESINNSIAVYDFADYGRLETVGEGVYRANNPVWLTNAQVLWESIEGSNVDAASEMAASISAQRSLQSCSQALKMYDQILNKAATDIAKL
ncbi:MAG: flagellar hook-basal body complex protein [Clostridia bacterium]|nr:flagellar hook-basal body complex protein [Clostridia bacterium]